MVISMGFRRANTELSLDFRKANTEPSVIFRGPIRKPIRKIM